MAEATLRTPRFYAVLLGSFAVVGALLVMVGVGGVVAHAVSSKRREVGIKIALGAQPSAVRLSLTGRILLLAGLGLAAGSLGAVWLSGFLASQLYHVHPKDPFTFAGGAVLLMMIVAVAAWLPTGQMARTDPAETLRSE